MAYLYVLDCLQHRTLQHSTLDFPLVSKIPTSTLQPRLASCIIFSDPPLSQRSGKYISSSAALLRDPMWTTTTRTSIPRMLTYHRGVPTYKPVTSRRMSAKPQKAAGSCHKDMATYSSTHRLQESRRLHPGNIPWMRTSVLRMVSNHNAGSQQGRTRSSQGANKMAKATSSSQRAGRD